MAGIDEWVVDDVVVVVVVVDGVVLGSVVAPEVVSDEPDMPAPDVEPVADPEELLPYWSPLPVPVCARTPLCPITAKVRTANAVTRVRVMEDLPSVPGEAMTWTRSSRRSSLNEGDAQHSACHDDRKVEARRLGSVRTVLAPTAGRTLRARPMDLGGDPDV